MRIGIPRALMYYEYFPLWKTFFNELDAEVVLSDRTSRTILDNGSEVCINEACLPVKIYHGHIINLLSKNVDYIFIPRLRSVYKDEYICPKFTGLPEMIKFSIPNLPKIIDTEVFMWKNKAQLKDAFINCGSYISSDKSRILSAMDKALSAHKDYMTILEKGFTPINVLDGIDKSDDDRRLKIAVLGHVYNIYDNYSNMNILKKLYMNNVKVITPEMIDKNISDAYSRTLRKKLFWSFGRRIMGSAMHLFDTKEVDGIIYIMSFGCGIDSFIADILERRSRNDIKIPYLLIVIDEHTGEAGVNTRLEAFLDMIKWSKNDTNISAHR